MGSFRAMLAPASGMKARAKGRAVRWGGRGDVLRNDGNVLHTPTWVDRGVINHCWKSVCIISTWLKD